MILGSFKVTLAEIDHRDLVVCMIDWTRDVFSHVTLEFKILFAAVVEKNLLDSWENNDIQLSEHECFCFLESLE